MGAPRLSRRLSRTSDTEGPDDYFGYPTEPLVIQITVEPALNFQWYITEAARLAIANGGRWKDIPLFDVAYLVHVTRDEDTFPGIPRFLQYALFALLAGPAVMLGRHQEFGPGFAPARGAPSRPRAPSPGEAA